MVDVEGKLQCLERVLPLVQESLAVCGLCGRACGRNRSAGEPSFCVPTALPSSEHVRLASHTLHFGEEPMLVGQGGSGTVFFTHCNLRCVFCQNYQISQEGLGEAISASELAKVFLDLQSRGAENINLVTPTHFIYPILLAFREAYRSGLCLPVVYNTNGYDSVELLKLIEGIIDVYLPDLKYMAAEVGEKYSSAKRYPAVALAAIKEMYRQVGAIRMVGDVAVRGLIIRHLILPHNLSGTYEFLIWLKEEGMLDVTLGLMSQYAPRHRAHEYEELREGISHKEYVDLVHYAVELGFDNLLTQGLDSSEIYFPDFEDETPFSNT